MVRTHASACLHLPVRESWYPTTRVKAVRGVGPQPSRLSVYILYIYYWQSAFLPLWSGVAHSDAQGDHPAAAHK